ncbi:MAG: tRNA uridine-5-carboxymethylaminomethyl(34) synthesis GTPase MnmE, partial [Neomegalonema sp.]|nr:tRNA uridine-5-carboxymethylaminomethyl(34) synthesis GTPase MnmE [Neomegalonema sp.]
MLDTIYACASGAGPSAIAVYRLSGIQTDGVLTALGVRKLPETRLASLRRLYHPDNHQIVDEALILRFAAGASYTGEASAELHIHGGPAVRRALEEALELAGARLAEPGEFSRRALLNGRIDVAQAEAVAALVSAEADAQRRQALEILDGAVGVLAQQWRNELVGACALLETGIDFVEEGIEATIRD